MLLQLMVQADSVFKKLYFSLSSDFKGSFEAGLNPQLCVCFFLLFFFKILSTFTKAANRLLWLQRSHFHISLRRGERTVFKFFFVFCWGQHHFLCSEDLWEKVLDHKNLFSPQTAQLTQPDFILFSWECALLFYFGGKHKMWGYFKVFLLLSHFWPLQLSRKSTLKVNSRTERSVQIFVFLNVASFWPF